MGRPARLAGRLVLALIAVAPLAAAAGGAEVYGRPLRGLTPVPLADLASHVGKTVATRGRIEAVNGPRDLVVGDAGKTVAVTMRDPGVVFPKDLAGAAVTVEGVPGAGGTTFQATGAEVTRPARK